MATLPPEWKKWVLDNLLRGVSPQQLLNILRTSGFTHEAARAALGDTVPEQCPLGRGKDFYEKMSHPPVLERIEALGGEVLESERAQMFRLPGFLSAKDCDQLADLAKTKLRPSEIAILEGFEGFRTSSTCDLTYLNDGLADRIEKLIVDTMQIGLGEEEVIQAQHYAKGQEFKAHTDYFEPGAEEYRKYAVDGGQRTWTFMVYLTEGCEGGETEFVNLGFSVKPEKGTALVWNNLYPDGQPNPDTLHQAHPVTEGEKVVITKWFREQNL